MVINLLFPFLFDIFFKKTHTFCRGGSGVIEVVMEGHFYSGQPKPSRDDMDIEGEGEGVDEFQSNKTQEVKHLKGNMGNLKNPVVLFRQASNNLKENSDLCTYSGDGGKSFVILAKNLSPRISDKFQTEIIFNIMGATTEGFDQNVTNCCITNHFIPCSIHNSPLLSLLKSTKNGGPAVIPTWTDAISSIRQLLFFRLYFRKVALDNSEYSRLAEGSYQRIRNEVQNQFFSSVDHLLMIKEKGSMPRIQVLTLFIIAFENFTLNLLRSIEWNILDLLSVPIGVRDPLLTPNALPEAKMLSDEQMNTLRKHMCFYLRKRKWMYKGGLEELRKHGLLADYKEKDGEASMDVSSPDEGLESLESLEEDFMDSSIPKYRGYITFKTIESYLNFLDTPPPIPGDNFDNASSRKYKGNKKKNKKKNNGGGGRKHT